MTKSGDLYGAPPIKTASLYRDYRILGKGLTIQMIQESYPKINLIGTAMCKVPRGIKRCCLFNQCFIDFHYKSDLRARA